MDKNFPGIRSKQQGQNWLLRLFFRGDFYHLHRFALEYIENPLSNEILQVYAEAFPRLNDQKKQKAPFLFWRSQIAEDPVQQHKSLLSRHNTCFFLAFQFPLLKTAHFVHKRR